LKYTSHNYLEYFFIPIVFNKWICYHTYVIFQYTARAQPCWYINIYEAYTHPKYFLYINKFKQSLNSTTNTKHKIKTEIEKSKRSLPIHRSSPETGPRAQPNTSPAHELNQPNPHTFSVSKRRGEASYSSSVRSTRRRATSRSSSRIFVDAKTTPKLCPICVASVLS
jgi:hypothetical protein